MPADQRVVEAGRGGFADQRTHFDALRRNGRRRFPTELVRRRDDRLLGIERTGRCACDAEWQGRHERSEQQIAPARLMLHVPQSSVALRYFAYYPRPT